MPMRSITIRPKEISAETRTEAADAAAFLHKTNT
jgi:hypothetical protein